ncbi:Dps family protein [Olivibacter domesticus]|uniref:Starvation-inducible DNA-binding protein n=1 Tax=Olivibacter domesticus TaxID=407022 RepID=A0A1H7TLD4_OLID1|nr:DNA starvation/stationary phase protection protein [Olivibacter domesticus]SEL85234.1 starvation-inducible DNA-binding protein [Olivibacter domesticus]
MALTKTAKIDIGISEDNRQAVANILNHLLADEFVLYTKTRKFHWNVKGIHFHDLHLFFESQYKELAEVMDEVAERIRKLGHYSLGTLQQFLDETNLLEHTDDGSSAEIMIEALLEDHETIIRELRKAIDPIQEKHKDAGTADFLTGLMEQHESMAWMLRSMLQ